MQKIKRKSHKWCCFVVWIFFVESWVGPSMYQDNLQNSLVGVLDSLMGCDLGMLFLVCLLSMVR
jgi:uncharacterized membrane protein